MSANESRPAGAASELMAASKTSISQPTDTAQEARRAESALTFEDREAVRAAGYEAGMHHKFDLEVEDFARVLLHQDARKMSGFARRLAAAKGPAWEAMIVWSGASDD